MLSKFKNALKRRKVKLFLMFLMCSGLAWFVSQLSETYTGRTTFNLEYVNVPDSLMLTDISKNKIEVKLKASGFQFLGFNMASKKIRIDLSKMEKRDSQFYIPKEVYTKQIEQQLPSSMTLLESETEDLYFRFYEVDVKQVVVKSRVNVNLAQNYMLEEDLKVEPNTVEIKGPKEEIDAIEQLETIEIDLLDVDSNFSKKVNIFKPENLKNTVFSSNNVIVTGKVARFSEKMIEVPIEVINLPEGMQIRTFPDKVAVLCKAKLNKLKELDIDDFQIVVDYNTRNENSSNKLLLQIIKQPDGLHSASLEETQVEYIMKRE